MQLSASLASIVSSFTILFVASVPLPSLTSDSYAVTHGRDGGVGSFRAAVDAANLDTRLHRIHFSKGLEVILDSDVVYTGSQPLSIMGSGSRISGVSGPRPSPTSRGGLLVSTGGADLAIEDLSFVDSFDNGLGIFVPPTRTGVVSVLLDKVRVEGSRFHGVHIDGGPAERSGPREHGRPDCFVPEPVDSNVSIELSIDHSSITRNGRLRRGFDSSVVEEGEVASPLEACSSDFDGIRVDQGGRGGLRVVVRRSLFEGNRGDGIDLREAGPGDLEVKLVETAVIGNFDEGLEFDESGVGSLLADLLGVTASRNGEQGLSAREREAGDLRVTMFESRLKDSMNGDGVDLREEDAGDLFARLIRTKVKGNARSGVAVLQSAPGGGEITGVETTLAKNTTGPLQLVGASPKFTNSVIE